MQHAYAQAGVYTATVTATDGSGNASSTTRSIAIAGAGGRALISDLGVSPGTFVRAGRMVRGRCAARARANAHHRRCARTIALTIRYRLSAAAKVRLTVTKLLAGRLVHGRCVAPTHANRKHRSCVRALSVGTLTGPGSAGADHLAWNGSIAGRGIAPGLYRLTATASGGSAASTSFRITN